MAKVLDQLQERFPTLVFTPGEEFCWSPETNEIFYKSRARGEQADWSLLHETGHALLGHQSYHADMELLNLEVAAWQRARLLAHDLGITLSEDHIEDCLDTYRDWLHKRSICPTCDTRSIQQGDFAHYRCFNCHTTWRVSTSRFCRAYRRYKDVPQPTFRLSHNLQ